MHRPFPAVLAVIIAFACAVFPAAANPADVIATLDGDPITRSDVERYVDTVLSESYRTQLETEEGLQKLANHYINRTLLLEMAQKTIKSDDPVLKTHAGDAIDTERAYLSALIKREINDELRLNPHEVDAYMKKHGITNRTKAEYQMIPKARADLLRELIASARSGHEISFR